MHGQQNIKKILLFAPLSSAETTRRSRSSWMLQNVRSDLCADVSGLYIGTV